MGGNPQGELYNSKLREYPASERTGWGRLSEEFSRSESFRTTNVEIFELPHIKITEPQFVPSNDALIRDIFEMMQKNLEEQNERMSPRGWKIFEEKLTIAATLPPNQAQTDYINKINEEDTTEEDKIKLENKSSLEAFHDIIFNADDDGRRKILNSNSKVVEKEVIKERIELRRQMGMDDSRSMSI